MNTMNGMNSMNLSQLNLGRRESDKWLGHLLGEVLESVKNRQPIHTEHAKQLVSSAKRRPRRTNAQLKLAFKTALEYVQARHSSWTTKRQKVMARNLVKKYKF